MNFADEEYVRLYVSDTVTWKMIEWQGQCVLALMLRKFDKAGVFDFGKHGAERAVVAAIGLPLDVVKHGLERVLSEEIWTISGTQLFWPRYIEAQNCNRSSKLRQRTHRANKAANREDGPGWIYAVQSENGGDVKIGYASDLNSRLIGLQTARPDKLVVLTSFNGTMDEEKQLHVQFSNIRTSGEWFRSEPELMRWIDSKNCDTSHVAGCCCDDSLANRDNCHTVSHVSLIVTPGEERRGEGFDQDLPEESPERNQPSRPTLSPAERQERSFRSAAPDGVALFAAYKTESGKTGAEYDWKRRELFERLVSEGVTVETVVSAVRGAKLDRWARDTQKLAPASILGSAEQREKYSEIYRNPPKPVDEKPGSDRSASISEPRLSPRDRAAAFDLGPRSRSTPLTGTDPRASPKARPGATSTDSTERNVG